MKHLIIGAVLLTAPFVTVAEQIEDYKTFGRCSFFAKQLYYFGSEKVFTFAAIEAHKIAYPKIPYIDAKLNVKHERGFAEGLIWAISTEDNFKIKIREIYPKMCGDMVLNYALSLAQQYLKGASNGT